MPNLTCDLTLDVLETRRDYNVHVFSYLKVNNSLNVRFVPRTFVLP